MNTYPTFTSTDQLMRAVSASGSHYFSEDALRFFNARLDSRLYGGRFMVESIRRDDEPRAYRVLFVSDPGNGRMMAVEHLDTGRREVPEYSIDGDTYRTLDSARRAAQRIVNSAPECEGLTTNTLDALRG